MDYITTTELRTKSSQLVEALKSGSSVKLIHRSKVIGVIQPQLDEKPFDPVAFREALKKIKPKKIILRSQRDKIYRKHLMEKYGKGLS